jgi:hypothetical protein
MDPRLDPTPHLAVYLHPVACPGHSTSIEPVDCLYMAGAIEEFRNAFEAAGLVAIPREALGLVSRLLATLTGEEPIEPAPAPDITDSERRWAEQTWIVIRCRDGTIRRMGPTDRAWAEIVIGDLAWTPDPDVYSARLESQPEWIYDLLRELDDEMAA